MLTDLMRISAKGSDVYLSTLNTNDAQSICESINDPEVIAGISNPVIHYPYTIDDATQFIRLSMLKYDSKEEFHMGVRARNGNLVGLCAIFNIDRENRKAEVGYWLGRQHWGKGYAKGAMHLLLAFGFGELNLNRIHAKL